MRKRLKIYLFRHGQTFYNRDHVFTGWKDSKLTPKGIKDAKTIAKKLKNKKFGIAIYTRLSRSRDTLEEVLKFHPECKKILKDNRMMERSYGILEGKSHEEFIKDIGERKCDLLVVGDAIENLTREKRKKAEEFLGEQEFDLIHRGFKTKVPGGESFEDVEKRVKEFIKDLKRLMRKENVNVAISAHSNSIRLFRKIMEKASIKETVSWFIPYNCVFEYDLEV